MSKSQFVVTSEVHGDFAGYPHGHLGGQRGGGA